MPLRLNLLQLVREEFPEESVRQLVASTLQIADDQITVGGMTGIDGVGDQRKRLINFHTSSHTSSTVPLASMVTIRSGQTFANSANPRRSRR